MIPWTEVKRAQMLPTIARLTTFSQNKDVGLLAKLGIPQIFTGSVFFV